jgi:hydrogenase large subunit
MSTITIMDPVTRIEGHMKVEVTIDEVNGSLKVVDTRCTGTLFRGFETLLQGRDPWDAPVITERICGVCPVSHGMASVMALDAAAGVTVPTNARLLRNLVLGANFIQSHILHFYLLSVPDYAPGPAMGPWTPAYDIPVRRGLENLSTNMLKAIEARRRAHEMGAIFGGRNPSPHTYIPGGFTAVPNAARISEFRNQLDWLTDFIDVYIEDVETLASVYSGYFKRGRGYQRLLAYGVFDLDDGGSEKLLNSGYAVPRKDPDDVRPLRTHRITESVSHSWYDDQTGDLSPENGLTEPVDPLDKTDAYSWLKAPRYMNLPVEVGPLARMWINGDYRNGVSVMDRHLARAYETLKIAEAMHDWLDELTPGASVYTNHQTPASGMGVGLTEAPRGALGHWVNIDQGQIANYQIITPTCWNASPKDGNNRLGPMEKAIKGTGVKNPDQPIEVLRIIHSFDPCLSCAVHVMRPGQKPQVIYTGCE